MKSLPVSSISFVALLAASFTSHGAIVYSNDFDNGNANTSLVTSGISSVGWNTLYGNATTTTVTPDTIGPQYRSGYGDGTSPSGQNPQLTDYIYVQKSADATTGSPTDIDFIMRTNDSTITPFAPSAYTSLTAAWQRNGGTVAGHRFMVQTGGAWYVSATNYTSTGAGQSSSPLLNLLTTTWTNLDLSGGFLSIGSTSSTYTSLFGSGQTITGIGFYIDNLTGANPPVPPANAALHSFRLDTIVIEGVPEPTSAALGLLGLSAFCFRRRK